MAEDVFWRDHLLPLACVLGAAAPPMSFYVVLLFDFFIFLSPQQALRMASIVHWLGGWNSPQRLFNAMEGVEVSIGKHRWVVVVAVVGSAFTLLLLRTRSSFVFLLFAAQNA